MEVVFSESAGGALSVALGKGKPIGGVSAYIGMTKKEQKQWEEKERRNWDAAELLPGIRDDQIVMPLMLSVGDIDEQCPGPKRRETLQRLFAVYPEEGEKAAETMVETARHNLDILLSRAGQGERIRLYYSDQPDEACGAWWLMNQLTEAGLTNAAVTAVKLPAFWQTPAGDILELTAWGEVPPHQWGHLARQGQTWKSELIRYLSEQWQQRKRENAPLRAVINGSLISAPDTLYDPLIRQVIEEQEPVFRQAAVIGRVLVRSHGCMGDAWIAMRMEEMIRRGELSAVTIPASGDPTYHRLLRKRTK